MIPDGEAGRGGREGRRFIETPVPKVSPFFPFLSEDAEEVLAPQECVLFKVSVPVGLEAWTAGFMSCSCKTIRTAYLHPLSSSFSVHVQFFDNFPLVNSPAVLHFKIQSQAKFISSYLTALKCILFIYTSPSLESLKLEALQTARVTPSPVDGKTQALFSYFLAWLRLTHHLTSPVLDFLNYKMGTQSML